MRCVKHPAFVRGKWFKLIISFGPPSALKLLRNIDMFRFLIKSNFSTFLAPRLFVHSPSASRKIVLIAIKLSTIIVRILFQESNTTTKKSFFCILSLPHCVNFDPWSRAWNGKFKIIYCIHLSRMTGCIGKKFSRLSLARVEQQKIRSKLRMGKKNNWKMVYERSIKNPHADLRTSQRRFFLCDVSLSHVHSPVWWRCGCLSD